MYHRILLAVVMPLVCCCVDLYAQTVDSTKTYHIEEVSVSAQRIRKEVIPVQMLAGEELQKLSVHSVADAIRYFSGIQIKDYGGIGGLKTVNIRGLGTQHVGVFYDGVQLGNAQNGQIDLGRFSLDNMEAVSLYNGYLSIGKGFCFSRFHLHDSSSSFFWRRTELSPERNFQNRFFRFGQSFRPAGA